MKDTSFSHKNMYLLKVVSQLDTNNSKSFARCSAFIHTKQGIEAAIVGKDADTSWRIGVLWRQMHGPYSVAHSFGFLVILLIGRKFQQNTFEICVVN